MLAFFQSDETIMDFVSIDVSRVVVVLAVAAVAVVALRIVESVSKRRVVVRTRRMLASASASDASARRGDGAPP